MPRPRSDTVAAPGVLVAVGWMSPPAVGVCAGTNCGSLFSCCSSAAVEEFCSRPWSTVTIGLLDSKSCLTMREPVTTMPGWLVVSVTVLPSGWSGVVTTGSLVVVSCA